MTFEAALAFVLEQEGGDRFTDDPHDPGGATRWGISKRAYPTEDIPNMTRERAAFLYRRDYWAKCKCDWLPGPLAFALFDSAVNQGTDAAVKQLQRALSVTQDGVVGDDTIRAAKLAEGSGRLRAIARDFCRRRILRYARLPRAETYLGGWVGRVLAVYDVCCDATRKEAA